MQGHMTKRDPRRTGIPASRKGVPNQDYPLHAIIVDNPYAIEPGEKSVAMRTTRNDPLGNLHARKQIDEAQYQAGRAFQSDWEQAERGPRAIDPSKEAVDGGRMPEAITEGQRRAVMRLSRAMRELGQDGSAIAQAILVNRQTCAQIAAARQLGGQYWEKHFGRRFRGCLDTLAVVYNFAMPKRI